MRAVVQRVNHANVTVDNKVTGTIEKGLMVLLGVEDDDQVEDAIYMADKISGLRIFEDSEGKMNLSVQDVGGLGFNYKWNMGWMNDTLNYMTQDPFFRKGAHNNLTFSLSYFTTENYILPLSHDEVVHMKGSLINKMPGSNEEKFSNLRAYIAFMMAHPGKKLTFMGTELAQFSEWDYRKELDWNLLSDEKHQRFHTFIKDLNHFYLNNSSFWELDKDWTGFHWIDPDDSEKNIISFIRKNRRGRAIIVVCNFSPIPRKKYLVGVENPGTYRLVFSSSHTKYSGGDEEIIETESVQAVPKEMNNFKYSIEIDLPGLSTVYWR
jgi:1,4-alpha-glucan branching enzyme